MKKTGFKKIAQRYVKALFDTADEAGVRDVVEKDLSTLAAAVEENERFAEILANPLLKDKDQANLLNALLTPIDAHDITRRFVAVLALRKRLDLLPAIAEMFAAQAAEARGQMTAKLITATPLAAKNAQAISKGLSKAYGKEISLETSEDERLLGGAVLKIGSVELDSSLAGKLKRLEKTLKAA